jgi:asparagine synthase (glutamine-hydrolysing)
MCGIFAIFGIKNPDYLKLRRKAIELSKKIQHRGPDGSGVYIIVRNSNN